MDLITEVKSQLQDTFEIRDLKFASFYLGISITMDRTEETVFISQKRYIEALLKNFGMSTCKPSSVPMRVNDPKVLSMLTTENPNDLPMVPYRQLVGSLLYLAMTTRPDITFRTSFLARFMHSYSLEHWKAAKVVLRYLSRTKSMGLHYGKGLAVVGFIDADWAEDVATRKSTSGYVFAIGGTAFSWNSVLQTVVAAFSLEAEYIAQAMSVREALWVRGVASDLCFMPIDHCVEILADNTGAIAKANEGAISPKTKHIAVCYHLTRDYIEKGDVNLAYVDTTNMDADMFTKALSRTKLDANRAHIGLIDATKSQVDRS